MAFDTSRARVREGFENQIPGGGNLVDVAVEQWFARTNNGTSGDFQGIFNDIVRQGETGQLQIKADQPAKDAETARLAGLQERGAQIAESGAKLSEELVARQTAIAEQQIEIAKSQEERAKDLWGLYKEAYLPGELAFAEELFAGVRPDLAVGRSVAETQRQFTNIQGILEQQQRSRGISPGSPAAQAGQTRLAGGLASARAGAANAAREQTADLNRRLKAAAVAQGANLPGLAVGTSSQGASILGQAGGVLGQGLSGGLASLGLQSGIFDAQAGRSFSAQQSALNREFQTQQTALQIAQADKARRAAERGQLFQSIGQIAGTAIGAFVPGGAGLGGQIGGAVGGAAGGGSPTTNPVGGTDVNQFFGGTGLSLTE